MSTRIKELSHDIVNKIAAGEVVERPSSIVRELIENSLDAEATEVSVELVDAGKKYISVKDNGKGIHPEDITLALTRHATSKISNFEDLYAISSLGFRGEAIPAIASVSKTTIISKTPEDLSAVRAISEYGKIKNISKKATSDGTTLIVENLFSNVPARLKFLKKTPTELQHCITTINNYAMAYPSVSFKLIHNGRSLFFYPQSKDPETRLSAVYNTKHSWFTSNASYEYIHGEIYIMDPSKSDHKGDLRVFVNGRHVRDRAVSHAILSSFEKHLSTGQAPLCILFLSIDPSFVDTNVSPTKSEVRFREQNLVYTFVQSLIEQALKLPTSSSTKANSKEATYISTSSISQPNTAKSATLQESLELLYSPASNRKILGQFKNQYLVLEEASALVLIDQHAAHERINFEKIINTMKETSQSQNLLMPELVELGHEQALLLEEIIPELNERGFDIEKFKEEKSSKLSFTIRSVPSVLSEVNIKSLIYELLRSKFDNISRQTITRNLAICAAKLSCHDSIRGVNLLSKLEMEELLDNLEACEYPHVCPHGRPTRVEISLEQVEKLFKRK